ncbi:MAG: E3 binding domain-containing protein, partial [Planctomycetales bacterium]
MPHEIIVPRLGWSMEEGTFGEWLKRDGDSVQPGEPLFVLEGEKSAQDIEAIDGGILRIPADAPRPGDTVRVGQVLGYLVAEGEPLTDSSPPSPAVQQPQAAAVPAPAPVPAPVAAAGSPAPAAQPRHAAISPRARRLANQLGIDSHTLPGSGRTGRIRERDVRSAAERLSHVSPRAAAGTAHATQRVAGESAAPWLAISTIRKTIAARMSAGVHEAAPVTLTTRCDAANLVNLR